MKAKCTQLKSQVSEGNGSVDNTERAGCAQLKTECTHLNDRVSPIQGLAKQLNKLVPTRSKVAQQTPSMCNGAFY